MGNVKSHAKSGRNNGTQNVQESKNDVETSGGSNQTYPLFLQKFAEVIQDKSRKEEGSEYIACATFKFPAWYENILSPFVGRILTRKDSLQSTKKRCVSKPHELLGEKLFYHFLREDDSNSDKEMTIDIFLRQSRKLLECHTDFQQLQYYVKAFSSSNHEISYEEFYDLVNAAYEISTFARHSSSSSDTLLPAISKAVMHGKEKVTLSYVIHWLCEHCPRLVMWIHRYLCHILTIGYSTIPNNQDTEENDTETPVLDSATQRSCATMHPALIWMLSCTLPQTFLKSTAKKESPTSDNLLNPHDFVMNAMLGDTPTHWIALYNSDEHGLSLNRFCHHVFDYHSPTLLFITSDESMFCVAIDEKWKDSKHFYGGPNCMCIQLLPKYQVVEKGSNLVYFNTTSRGFPEGFQIGLDARNRTLTIDQQLKFVNYKRVPYKLLSLEAWGCGTDLAKRNQLESKKLAKHDAEARRVVKLKANDWVDHPDRCLLDMAGVRPSYAIFDKESQSQFTKT